MPTIILSIIIISKFKLLEPLKPKNLYHKNNIEEYLKSIIYYCGAFVVLKRDTSYNPVVYLYLWILFTDIWNFSYYDQSITKVIKYI